MKNYDLVIVGGGPAGLYTAFGIVRDRIQKSLKASESVNKLPKILIIEKGNPIEKRSCPALKNKTTCVRCSTCSIMEGMAGAGAFSDGKFPITNDFGGNLWEKIGKEKALELMRKVDDENHELFRLSSADLIKRWPKLFSSKTSSKVFPYIFSMI